MLDNYEEYEKYIRERIGKLRIQKDISAKEMSSEMGLSIGYITNIENKISKPSLRGLYNICKFLNISPKDFFDEETKNPVLISELIEAVKDLDDNSLKALLTIAKNMKK